MKGWRRRWHVFAQQAPSKNKLPLWLYRRKCQTAIAGCCAVFFGIIGTILITTAAGVFEQSVSYLPGDISKDFVLDKDVEGPLHLSYVLPGFKGNQKGYIESKSRYIMSYIGSAYSCDGMETVASVEYSRAGDSYFNGLVQGAVAPGETHFKPCGLTAMSMFTDEYRLYSVDQDVNISLDESSVSLPKDEDIYKDKFVLNENGQYEVEEKLSWVQPGNFFEHFKVWFRPPCAPIVRNLWATIDGTLKAGTYRLYILRNTAIWTNAWQLADKQVILSASSALGSPGSCQVLGTTCFVICVWQALLAVVLLVVPSPPPGK